jgi:cytochrome c-type protein NapB
MTKSLLLSVTLASLLSLPARAVEVQSIPDFDLGLTKAGVLDNPTPAMVRYQGGRPGSNKLFAQSYDTAPPMIPHSIAGMLPITRDSNRCSTCHDESDMIGKPLRPGKPIPMPASHYVDAKKGELNMGRWNCTQCHRPQADAKLLIPNVFGQAGKTRH